APRPYKSAIENDVPAGQGSGTAPGQVQAELKGQVQDQVQGQEQEQLRQEMERHQSEIKRILTGR
ncbi:MAG: hypothetical protein K2X47_14115, partial [Bdellovibrionales bacterium]|nr:hypothetical protein [Bdellovibrionales bacterium]